MTVDTELKMKTDQIEKTVCIPIHNCRKVPMDRDTTEILMRLLMGKAMPIPEKDKPWLYKVIETRVKACFTIVIEDPKLILFLALISKSPGNAIMYLWYLQYWCFKNRAQIVDLNLFCNIFPVGFPSEAEMQKIWDAQKVKAAPDNLVDHAAAGESIQIRES